MKLKVAIFGFGPTGCFVQKACNDKGIYPVVFTQRAEYGPSGAFFIHEIPGKMDRINVLSPQITMRILCIGSRANYNTAQGFKRDYASSFIEGRDEDVIAYTREILPSIAPPHLRLTIQEKIDVIDVYELVDNFDVSFLTFSIDPDMDIHKFYAPAIHGKADKADSNYILYNGTMAFPFARRTKIGEYITEEYGESTSDKFLYGRMEDIFTEAKIIRIPDMDPDTVPLPTKVDNAHNLFRVGRWAQWNRHMLSHEAYHIAEEIICKHSGIS